MECSCIKDKSFNFTIDYDKDNLIFTDKSIWVTSPNRTPIEDYGIKIKNGNTFILVNVLVNRSTLIPFDKLPRNGSDCYFDGIYNFVTEKICDQIYQKDEAILKNVHCAYSKLLLKTPKSSDDWVNLDKIMHKMEYIKNATRTGQVEQAQTQYNQLAAFLKKINCHCY